MLLTLILLQSTVAILANPFHKYPYVFLLDVGNEEIEKTNTEQIRLTIPGGSLALKYPATGDGDTIGHVRVSGVDFGTDLKASIVQGGPGYKYVVLVFMGNPGVAYDAVVTIQTVANMDRDQVTNIESGDTNEGSEDDTNNSAEETSDTEIKNVYSENENIEAMQSSSNIYKYTSDELENQNSNDENENSADEESEDNEEEVQDKENEDYSDDKNQNFDLKNDYAEDGPIGNSHVYSLNDNQYGKYEAFRPLIIGGVRFYPQASLYTQDGYSKPIYDQENHANDDVDEENENYKDTNNNVDPDYGSPVEY